MKAGMGRVRGSWVQPLLRIALLLGALLGTTAQAGTVTYVYTDAQGTPVMEADAQGNVTATFDYAPYGAQALGTPPAGPGYTGHVNDPDTGFVYMQARYYDPVGPSPGELFHFNRYDYTNNNPISNIDPDGRKVLFADNFSPTYRRQYEKAKSYLEAHGVAGEIKNLESRKETVTIYGQSLGVGASSGKVNGQYAVIWSPYVGTKTSKGVTTPALALLHEVAHIQGRLDKQDASREPDGTAYDNAEEKRVIQTIEVPAAT